MKGPPVKGGQSADKEEGMKSANLKRQNWDERDNQPRVRVKAEPTCSAYALEGESTP